MGEVAQRFNPAWQKTMPLGKNKKRVLVLDDEKDICLLLSTILTGLGYEVNSSYSLKEGKQMLDDFEPDILFLDIHLPDGSGLDDLPLFREKNKKLEIIIISAYDSFSEIKEANRYRAAFLRKPFSKEKIIEALKAQPTK